MRLPYTLIVITAIPWFVPAVTAQSVHYTHVIRNASDPHTGSRICLAERPHPLIPQGCTYILSPGELWSKDGPVSRGERVEHVFYAFHFTRSEGKTHRQYLAQVQIKTAKVREKINATVLTYKNVKKYLACRTPDVEPPSYQFNGLWYEFRVEPVIHTGSTSTIKVKQPGWCEVIFTINRDKEETILPVYADE